MPKKICGIDEVALHYGFETANIPPMHINGIPSLRPEEKISILRSYLSSDLAKEDSVSMIYNNKALLINNRICKKNSSNLCNYSFDIVGVPSSMAEAIVIQTAVVALTEAGFENISVDINSIGGKESFALFKNELFNYYKERAEELHPKCRNFERKNTLDLLKCSHKECQALRDEAPKSIYFLSENSQKHLKEVLEHLESSGITYRINDSLIGADNYFSKIIFEIKSKFGNQGEEILLGKGGRYDDLAKKITKRKESTAVGVSLEIEKRQQLKNDRFPKKDPRFYFIQFGPKAKLRSLSMMEILRQSGLSIQQSLYMNKLSDQITAAQKSKIPYAIIMGQKEATEDTVIVKDFRKASQETVSTGQLLSYLQQLR